MTAVRKKSPKTASEGDSLPASARTSGRPDPETHIVNAPAGDPDWQAAFYAEIRRESARIPARFQGKTLKTFVAGRDAKLQSALHYVNSYISRFKQGEAPEQSGAVPPQDVRDPEAESQARIVAGTGLLLRGPSGCGKTHMAVAVLKEIIAKGYRGLYYNITDLLVQIRETYSADSSVGESEFLDDIVAPDVLVIDDLGSEKTTEWVNDRLYLIINRRYEDCRPLLLTTNLITIEEMEQKLGKRITSRLCEMCTFIDFPDSDFRKKHMH